MKKIFAILVVLATVTAAVFAGSDDQSFKMNTAEQAADTELILEDWMLSPVFESVNAETEMDLENWMIDTDSCDSCADEKIELEDWMIEDSNSTRTAENDLVLENWMFIYS